jgi:hypothetical protein
VNNQLKQITTMTQELQQVTAYVKAFGDPSSLLNITGANQLISNLRQTGVGQTIGQLHQAANGIQALQYTANGLYTNLGSTFTTPGGVHLPRAEELYRKYGAIQQSSQNFQGLLVTYWRAARTCATRSPLQRLNCKRQAPMPKRRSWQAYL